MDLPVCLIENTEDGKFQVNAKAIDILCKITQPVVVVAIVGPYRTGKSYLMNKLARTQKGFDVGSTVQAQTKGIWMRCLPHPTKDSHTLVLLDTEGLENVEKGDKNNDMWIFCLAVLLSSALIYNSKAIIDEYAIEKLHCVSELVKFIKVKSTNNDKDEAEYSRHFPIFIWTVRDVTLQLESNGKPITEDEYLENSLMLKKAKNMQENLEKVEQHNKYRECIRMYFKTRKCFMFDHPSCKKKVLVKMDEVSENQLTPEFMDQTKNLCDYVYNNAEVKYMDNMYKVTGETLAQLTTMYTEAINSCNTVCMEDVVTNLSVVENTAAVKEATHYYESKMKENVTFPTETLDQMIELSQQCEMEALKIFMRRSLKDKDHQFHKQFLEIIQNKKNEFFERNYMESRIYCENLIKTLSKDLEDSVKEGSFVTLGGYQMFKEEMERIDEKYKNEPRKGTMAEDILQEFKKSKEMIGLIIMMNDKALSDQQRKIEEEKAKAEKQEMERKMKANQKIKKNKKEDHKRKIIEENLKKSLEKANNENKLLQEQLQAVMKAKEREQDMYRCQGYEEHARKYHVQINDITINLQKSNVPFWLDGLKSIIETVISKFF